jgi:hypothetical protein
MSYPATCECGFRSRALHGDGNIVVFKDTDGAGLAALLSGHLDNDRCEVTACGRKLPTRPTVVVTFSDPIAVFAVAGSLMGGARRETLQNALNEIGGLKKPSQVVRRCSLRYHSRAHASWIMPR